MPVTPAGVGHRHLYTVTFSDGDQRIGQYVQRMSLPVIGYADSLGRAVISSWVSDPYESRTVPIEFIVDSEGLLLPFLSKYSCASSTKPSDLDVTVDLLTTTGTTHTRVYMKGVTFANMCTSELYNQQSGILIVEGSLRYTSVEFRGSST